MPFHPSNLNPIMAVGSAFSNSSDMPVIRHDGNHRRPVCTFSGVIELTNRYGLRIDLIYAKSDNDIACRPYRRGSERHWPRRHAPGRVNADLFLSLSQRHGREIESGRHGDLVVCSRYTAYPVIIYIRVANNHGPTIFAGDSDHVQKIQYH